MGTWGTAISANYTYEDLKYQFYELYNQGLKSKEVTRQLLTNNQDIIKDFEEVNNFWFALASFQWECKALEPKLLEKVTDIINSRKDVELWKELGAEKSDLAKREKTLKRFLEKLNTEKKKPKRRVRKKFYDGFFEKGTCISFKLENGNYGAAFILEAEKQTELGLNLVAVCDYNNSTIPELDYFQHANLLIHTVKEKILWLDRESIKQIDYAIVGQLTISKKYIFDDFSTMGLWGTISYSVINSDAWITTKSKLKQYRLET